jgi:hypothetical protein
MGMDDDQHCTICLWLGEFPGTLADLVKGEALKQVPLFAWAEPEVTAVDPGNGTGRRTGFRPLVKGVPDWNNDPPLVEARLFWRKMALHAVIASGRCRWVKVEEGDGHGADPGHRKLIVENVRRESYDICTLRDWQRFGLETDQSTQAFSAIEYWRNGRLITWRLM